MVYNNLVITCDFEILGSTPILEAGSWKPEILVTDVGFVKYADAITNNEIATTITSVTPNTVAPNGGTEITIVGIKNKIIMIA